MYKIIIITTSGVCICKITPQDISSCNFSMWHIDWGYKDEKKFNLKFEVCGDVGFVKGVALMQMKLTFGRKLVNKTLCTKF